MKRNNLIVMGIIAAIMAFAISALVLPLFGRQGMRLDLDLNGGVRLVYQLQYPDNASSQEKADLRDRAITVIKNRIDQFGVANPVVQTQGNDRISIKLPGFTDPNEARNLVEKTGFLEFRTVELNKDSNPVYLSDYLNGNGTFFDTSNDGSRIFAAEDGPPVAIMHKNEDGTLTFSDLQGNQLDVETLKQRNTAAYSWIPALGNDGTPLTGALLASATPQISTSTTGAQAYVAIEWNKEGGTIFDQIAARLNKYYNATSFNIRATLGIFLDQSLISFPQVTQPSYGGSGIIEGGFTQDEAKQLATLLSSGALPLPLERQFSTYVSPTLGQNFVDMSLLAGIVAIILIMVFMVIYYRIPGLMASLALLFYGSVILAVFKLWPVTLNLAGIGGFVLSIGMAVDANVLIFERMKEEIRQGRNFRYAVNAGFKRAWLAIRDSNITTFIACIILYWVGNSVINGEAVKGFSLTLFIGVAVSMFTCMVVTRGLLNLFISTRISQKISLFSAWSGRK